MLKILTVFACLGLAGCVAPPILTYASLALDGASFVTTGKSVGDHALSAAVDEDCAVLRVVTEQDVEAVCREYASQEEREAAVAPTVVTAFKAMFTVIEPGKVPPRMDVDPETILPIAFMDETVAYMEGPGAYMVETDSFMDGPDAFMVETDSFMDETGMDETGMDETGAFMDWTDKSGARDEKLENRRAIYLMIGNFPSIDGAEKLAARVTGMSAVVAPAMAGDARYFRVVAGPIAPGKTDAARSRLAAVGIDYSWAASLCTRDLGAPPCDDP